MNIQQEYQSLKDEGRKLERKINELNREGLILQDKINHEGMSRIQLKTTGEALKRVEAQMRELKTELATVEKRKSHIIDQVISTSEKRPLSVLKSRGIDSDHETLNDCSDFDSEIFEEWIAGCIRKHVNGSIEPKMTKEQCLATAYEKLRKGEIRRANDSNDWINVDGTIIALNDPAGDDIKLDALNELQKLQTAIIKVGAIETRAAKDEGYKREALETLSRLRTILRR